MRTGYSRTAEGMALIRAMEHWVPASRRILDDRCSASFVRHWPFRVIARSQLLSRAVIALLDRWAPGGQEFLTIRARLTDVEASNFAASGGSQIVILGAGFDTLALRLHETLKDVTIYEVDHPGTQKVKREVLETLTPPANLRLIAVDFEKDDFVAKLQGAGFNPSIRSLFIWVGVTYYLTPQSVEESFERLSRLLVQSSRVVFDYLLKDVIEGTSTNRDAMSKARRVAQLGEPWLFGLRPDEIAEFLDRFGLQLIQDFNSHELGARYAPGRRTPMDYARMVICECK
ncbi:MAG: SAM-dependent methyltransferase [Acidobacteriota bacterium]